MAVCASSSDLLARLESITTAHGVTVNSKDDRALRGTQETIKSKWFLGGRKVTYRMSCELDDGSRTVRFREAVAESSWGVPPPTFTVETTTQRGTRVTESRTDRGVGGGGHLDYGSLREDFAREIGDDGWQFTVEGRIP